jgi:hypothetical protein
MNNFLLAVTSFLLVYNTAYDVGKHAERKNHRATAIHCFKDVDDPNKIRTFVYFTDGAYEEIDE